MTRKADPKRMIVVRLGYASILLPDDKHVSAILNAFREAVEVNDHLYRGEIELLEPLKVEVKTVPPGTVFKRRGDVSVVDPALPSTALVPSVRRNGRGRAAGLRQLPFEE